MKLNVSKIDKKVLSKYLAHYDIKFALTDENLEEGAGLIVEHYRGMKPRPEIAKCDNCGGISALDLPCCPYCGDEDVDETPAAPAPKTAKKAAPAKKVAKKVAKKGGQQSAEPPEEPAAAEEPAEPAKVAKKTVKKTAKKVAKKTAKKVARRAEPERAEEEVDEEATPTETALESSAAALDEQCRIIQRTASRAASELWDMGRAFKEIVDNDLWKLRVNEDGIPLYTNFKTFCAQELQCSGAYAYTLIKGSEKFTKDEITELGFRRLRAALVEDKDDGTETQEDGRQAPDRGPQRPAPNRITIAVAPGVVEVDGYKMPKPGAKNQPLVRARTIKDEPHAIIELENDVQLHIRATVNVNKEVVFIAEFKRVR